jgi:hypothetical protein
MFVVSDLQYSETNGWYMFANMVGQFGKKEHQYECVTKLGVLAKEDVTKIQEHQKNGGLYASNQKEEVLYQMLLDGAKDEGKILEETKAANCGILPTLQCPDHKF